MTNEEMVAKASEAGVSTEGAVLRESVVVGGVVLAFANAKAAKAAVKLATKRGALVPMKGGRWMKAEPGQNVRRDAELVYVE